MMKQYDIFKLAEVARDLGIFSVCLFFSLSNLIGVLVGIRKFIEKRLFIRRQNKSARRKVN